MAKSYNYESWSNSSNKFWANLKRNLTLFTSGPLPVATSYQSVSSKSPILNWYFEYIEIWRKYFYHIILFLLAWIIRFYFIFLEHSFRNLNVCHKKKQKSSHSNKSIIFDMIILCNVIVVEKCVRVYIFPGCFYRNNRFINRIFISIRKQCPYWILLNSWSGNIQNIYGRQPTWNNF